MSPILARLLRMTGFLPFALAMGSGGRLVAEQLNVQLTVTWEGRELEEPNLEALEKFRRTYPEIPVVHLINPSYFSSQDLSLAHREKIQRVILPDDEVGLYLSAERSILDQALVNLRLQPTFWAYIDDLETCSDYCGLDVPLNSFSREEFLRIFARSDQLLREQGFQNLRSFAVRGWLSAPFVRSIAEAFAYRFDLTRVDSTLVQAKLREYPLSNWLTDGQRPSPHPQWLSESSGRQVEQLTQNGAIVELNEQSEVMKSLDRTLEQIGTQGASFRLSLSQESAYQSWPRLRAMLKELEAKARQKGTRLVYTTPAQIKNGRPQQDNMRISVVP